MCDTNNYRVQVFRQSGELITHFQSTDTGFVEFCQRRHKAEAEAKAKREKPKAETGPSDSLTGSGSASYMSQKSRPPPGPSVVNLSTVEFQVQPTPAMPFCIRIDYMGRVIVGYANKCVHVYAFEEVD